MAVFGWRQRAAAFVLDAFDGVLGAEPAAKAERRGAFASANLVAGGIGVSLWPLHWIFIGPVDSLTGLAFFFLWTPLALGLYVKGGGELEHAEVGSAVALAAFVTFVALLTGGLASPALSWLLVAPIEAAVAGRRAGVLFAATAAGAGAVVVLLATLGGWLAPSLIAPSLLGIVTGVSLFAALVVGTLSLRAFQRRHAYDMAHVRLSAAAHRELTDGVPDLITRHRDDGTVLSASLASEEMLGLAPGELQGLSPAMIVHIQDLTLVEDAFERAAAGEAQTFAFRMRRRDGSYVPVEMRAQRLASDIVAVTREMGHVHERERELEAERDAAEEKSRAKSRFLASVTHELRTPLNAIIGFSDVMRSEIMGPIGNAKYHEYATLIRDSGMHLVDLISDLLDMSKIEAGKFTISTQACELKPLFDECAAIVRGQAETTGIEFAVDCAPGLTITADKRALKQCLLNLLSNAIKFTLAEGRVQLTARIESGHAVILVADTGVGIPADELHRIGRPFEQVEGELQRTHRGTGLGLSLVKALVELHDGTMEIKSGLGDGTTVTLRLPTGAKEAQARTEHTLVYPERFRARA